MSNNQNKTPKVDEMGIRLAPAPMTKESEKMLPAVRQDFVMHPVLEIDEPQDVVEPSTSTDYQPKRKDLSKRLKRSKRTRNIVCGLIMFVFLSLILLQYTLAAVSETLDFIPFKYVPTEYNVIGNLIDNFTQIKNAGWTGSMAAIFWKACLPDFILGIGIVFVLVNLIKAILGIFGAIKVKRYIVCSVVYLLVIIALFIAALVGAEEFGINKISFVNDFIKGWQTSEFFGLLITAAAGLLASIACSLINPEKSGYTK